MFEKIKEAFRNYTFLSPRDLVQIAGVAKVKRFKKGEHFVRVGDLNFHGALVLSGLLCHYVIDENGMEKTLLLVPEGMNSGSLQTFVNEKAADENIVALENTLLLLFDMRAMNKLAETNFRILKLINKRYKQIISEAAERIKLLVVFTPEESYLYFCKTFPNLEKRIKQKQLASYLGITPTSLSRLKARLGKM